MFRLYLCFMCLFPIYAMACTTMLITKGATKDGSVIVGHSDDNELGDERIVKVPARDYPKGAKRPVFLDKTTFPRLVTKEKAKAYDTPGFPEDKPIGYIDQVSHTYAYIEGNYGILNEHQLAIGECTNSVYYYYDSPGKDRLLGIVELSRIALERCKKAKDAVKVMGELAEKYGYYTWGETLLLADPDEGWVFEISCTPDGTSAIWVAKKVPDGEIFVAANQFRIQEVRTDDPDILYSSNLFDIAKQQGWDGKEPLNWVKLVCPGEFDHPYYSLRRVWRVFDRCNPSLNLSPWVENAYTKKYPFSIKPKEKLSLQDVISFYRDHYEGTQFNMRKGLAAGPYGCPNRNLGTYDRCDFPNKRKTRLKGAWERSISIYYTGYTYVTQIRKWLPDPIGAVTWVGFDDPYTTCFMPIYAGVIETPISFTSGSPQKYTKSFAWWPFNLSANWIVKNYEEGVKDIQNRQTLLEDMEIKRQKVIEKNALDLYQKNQKRVPQYLTEECNNLSKEVISSWWELFHYLVEKYNDGYVNKPKMTEMIGYPQWWRDDVGYQDGPIDYQKNLEEK